MFYSLQNTRIILKLVDLTFSTLVLMVNFHLVSSVSFIDALFLKKVSTPDLLLQSHIRLDPELMEALLVFVLSDIMARLFQLTNNFPGRNFEVVKSLLFIYLFVEGFFIK